MSWATRRAAFIGLCLVAVNSQQISIFVDWESGFPDGSPHLPIPLAPTFSFNEISDVKSCSSSTSDSRRRCKCGDNGYGYNPYGCETNYGPSDLHYVEMLTVPWARSGNGIVKMYADGRNAYNQGSGDSSFRSELGATRLYFYPGDEMYYSISFWCPSEYWDRITDDYTIITQFKQSPNGGRPHGLLKLSNEGDYRLIYRTNYGLFDDVEVGTARKDAWNDLKIYYKKSFGSDGRLRVYLNGANVFDHAGATLPDQSHDKVIYVKFGMYTGIRDERVIYFDALSLSSFLPSAYASSMTISFFVSGE